MKFVIYYFSLWFGKNKKFVKKIKIKIFNEVKFIFIYYMYVFRKYSVIIIFILFDILFRCSLLSYIYIISKKNILI